MSKGLCGKNVRAYPDARRFRHLPHLHEKVGAILILLKNNRYYLCLASRNRLRFSLVGGPENPSINGFKYLTT